MMNKYQEAFIGIQDNEYQYGTDEQWDLLKELVDKATPIKFVKSYSKHGTESWLCPSCRRKLKREWQFRNNYCPKCGQMIDYGEEDET